MKIIKKISVLASLLALCVGIEACGNQSNSENSTQFKSFPKFQGVDFDGNKVNETIFQKNKITVLNLWFNECSGCVKEIPALEEFNKELKKKGVEIVGLNVNATGRSDSKVIDEAKQILKKQGGTYRNISMIYGTDVKNFLSKIIFFPTNVLVDQKGNIIGEPMPGDLDNKEAQRKFLELIDKVISGQKIESKDLNSDNSEMSKLDEEMDKVFENNSKIWDVVFDSIDKEKVAKGEEDIPYADVLLKALENCKGKLTEEQIKKGKEDIKKIRVLDKKMLELKKRRK
ncbi:MAG: TlpA family protein disulfide reductase [Fusobacterium necrophorum]|nr:TlpA family protein disulfide reductase [Fusobacterium necrophorum]